MKNWMSLVLLSFLVPTVSASAGETLYNGIELPDKWPPQRQGLEREPMLPPYLEDPPEVIAIDVGRQLFVDDFLIEETNLERTFHRPTFYKNNPIIKPDQPWETSGESYYLVPFQGRAMCDPKDGLFKMWYLQSTQGDYYCDSVGYAISKDGIHWEKPIFAESRRLDAETVSPKAGTNLVLHVPRTCNNVVMLDHNARSPEERFKILCSDELHGEEGWLCVYRTSPDGIHWSEALEEVEVWGDFILAFYNPFRRKWVYQARNDGGDVGRCRAYMEASDARELVKQIPYNEGMDFEGDSVPWVGADDLDPRHPDPRFGDIAPELYALSVTPYESLMLGLFAIWAGPDNNVVADEGIQKHVEILTGFSRDGFHWARPDRRPLISPSWEKGTWNFGNVQPVGGACLVVGDKLHIYFSGRMEDRTGMHGNGTTGLAFLRRDGFASIGSIRDEGYLTTRPLRFSGKYLFVNTDCKQGELRVEVLDEEGVVIAPFTREDCEVSSVDSTRHQVRWDEASDLSELAGKPVRFRFTLRLGELYSFWVSPEESGASHGYVGAGGPGFTGPTDTVGQGAL